MSTSRTLAKMATAVTLMSVTMTGLPAANAAVPSTVPGVASVVPTVRGSSAQDAFEAEVLRLTNKARSRARKCGGTRKKAVRPLKWSTTLAASANAHSADMATKDYFSHYNKSGKSPFQRMRASGYNYRAAGENIAAGRSLASPQAVVKAWLRSPGHCKVIMNGKYKELGVGRVEGPGKWGVYWTQNFGARK
jgi:uncharacterized protein YkwD